MLGRAVYDAVLPVLALLERNELGIIVHSVFGLVFVGIVAVYRLNAVVWIVRVGHRVAQFDLVVVLVLDRRLAVVLGV